jgi:uncharacterized membrane protein YidH (DUF202 family)
VQPFYEALEKGSLSSVEDWSTLGLGNGRFCYDSDVAAVERVWMRILGVLLILLGLVLLASPLISYMRSERMGNSRYSVKSERLIVVPRPVAVLIVVAGAVALILSRKDSAAS